MDPIETIAEVFVFALFFALSFVVRAGLKDDNPKYSFIDDIIFFTGVPLWCLLTIINIIITVVYTNLLDMSLLEIYRMVRESDFTGIVVIALFCWTILGFIILAVRGANGRKH